MIKNAAQENIQNLIVPKIDRISILSSIRDHLIMMPNAGTIRLKDEETRERVRSFLGTISKKNTWEILIYLLQNGAITSVIARKRLGVPRRSAFRSLESLVDLGVIELKTRTKVPTRTGKAGNVYALLDANLEDIQGAVRVHNLLISSGKYRFAEGLAQTILEEFEERNLVEYNYRQIVDRVKELQSPYSTHDLSQMVLKLLREKGIKVWL